VNYCTNKTTNQWCSIDAYFNVLSIQHLQGSIIVSILISLPCLSFYLIETGPCGKREQHNNLVLFTLTRLKMIYNANKFIAPAIHLFMNRYSEVTFYHLPIKYLKLKLSVKLHKAGEPLTHSVLGFFPFCISPHFSCIDRHQHLFSLSLWLACRRNQSGHIWRGTHILLRWVFQILDAIVVLYIGFIIHCATLFAVIWNIQVAIPV